MAAFTFLGQPCLGGVNTAMAALTAAEAAIRAAYAAAGSPGDVRGVHRDP